jgi:hypothetical protein
MAGKKTSKPSYICHIGFGFLKEKKRRKNKHLKAMYTGKIFATSVKK